MNRTVHMKRMKIIQGKLITGPNIKMAFQEKNKPNMSRGDWSPSLQLIFSWFLLSSSIPILLNKINYVFLCPIPFIWYNVSTCRLEIQCWITLDIEGCIWNIICSSILENIRWTNSGLDIRVKFDCTEFYKQINRLTKMYVHIYVKVLQKWHRFKRKQLKEHQRLKIKTETAFSWRHISIRWYSFCWN